MADPKRLQRTRTVAGISLGVTILVVAIKLVGAALSGAVSVLSEALQSTVDVVIAFSVWKTIGYAAAPPDEDHPYGHGKAEVLLSLIQMQLVLLSSGFILYKAYGRLIEPQPLELGPGLVSIAVACALTVTMSLYVRRQSKKLDSEALRSESVHLRGDALSTGGVLVGLMLVWATGWVALDPIVAAAFTVFAMVSALRHIRRVIHPLMDGALPDRDIETIMRVLRDHPSVLGYHDVRTRKVGTERHVDLHLLLADELSFSEAHRITEQVELELQRALGGAWVNAHYEPYQEEIAHRREVHGDAPIDAQA